MNSLSFFPLLYVTLTLSSGIAALVSGSLYNVIYNLLKIIKYNIVYRDQVETLLSYFSFNLSDFTSANITNKMKLFLD